MATVDALLKIQKPDTTVVPLGANTDGEVVVADASVLAQLVAILTELQAKYEGGPIALDASTLAALETINATVSGTVAISNLPGSQAQADIDTFNAAIMTERYNQAEIDFITGVPATLATTTSGGGTVTAAAGHGIIQTSTGANGKARIDSVELIDYRPGFEVYFWGTAAFTTPTSAVSFQRFGLYDDNNGFFIGYEGTTFGVTRRRGAVDTFIPQTSWNLDKLDGTTGSKFTRDGVIEALNKTLVNVYRIRFGWFGSAVIRFEAFSPDGTWVPFHIIRQPNTERAASIQSPNLPVRIQVSKTGGDGTNLAIETGCAAAGVTSPLESLSSPISDQTLAQMVRAVLTAKQPNGQYTNIVANAQGRLLFANDSVGVDGSAPPAGTTAIGGTDGTNLQLLLVDSTGKLVLPAVALDSATLAALETINAVVSGTVAVSNAIDLSATTLAALETINAVVSGTVAVSNLPVTQPVSGTVTVANPTTNPETGLAKDATVQYQKNKFQPGVRTTGAATVNTVGDNTVYTPAAGKKVRVYWIGMSSSQNNTGENKVTVKFASGGTAKYIWRMGNPGAFSHWEPIEGGVNEALILNLTTTDAVDVNYTLEEV